MSRAPEHDLTFLFTDIEGSTRLWSRAPAAMAVAVPRQETLLRRVISAAGGRVFKTVGDGVYAVFAHPWDAVAAAVAGQRALLAEPWEGFEAEETIRVRIALHTGEAELRDDDYFGPTLNRLSRTLGAGHGSQILCTDATLAACGAQWPDAIEVRDLGQRTLRDVPGSGRIFQLVAAGLPEHFPPLVTLDPRVHNLPRWSSPLINRDIEQARIRSFVRSRSTRMITVLGTGGVGKTRLATEAVAPLLDEFQDGIRFVDLSALRDDAQVVPAIVQATGAADQLLDPRDALLDWLRPRSLLLVLDNCEQVIAGVAAVCRDVLNDAPDATILATSRVPIRIRGERQVSLDPLPLPDSSLGATTNPAVRLFTERAREVDAEFTLDAEATAQVSEICRIVDGLPLAIELAAPWVRILSPDALRRRLQENRGMLRDGARDLPDRQRALTATITWSYELLAPEDQRAFRRLAVFRGGIAVDAAAAVIWDEHTRDPLWALSRLDALVQANLLQVAADPRGEPRFTMLQTIQAFAVDILRSSGEGNEAAIAHAEFFGKLADEAYSHYRSDDVAMWFDRLDRDFENLRTSIEHFASRPQPSQAGLEMAVSLWEFLDQRGHEDEARRWLALLFDDTPALPARLRARAQVQLGNSWLGNLEQAEAFYQGASIAAREAGDDALLRLIEGSLASVALLQGNIDHAIDTLETIVDQERQMGDQARLGDALMHLAKAYCDAALYHRALVALDEARSLALDPASNAWFDLIRGKTLRRMGEVEAALESLESSREGFIKVEATLVVALCLYETAATLLPGDLLNAHRCIATANGSLGETLDPYNAVEALDVNAALLVFEGEPELAAKVAASTNAWRTMAGVTPPQIVRLEHEKLNERIRQMVGEEIHASCVAAGEQLSLRAAIDLISAAITADTELHV